MPELPEVEVVRRGLESHVVGRTFTTVAVLHPRPVRSFEAGPEGFAAELTDRRVSAMRRRGKFLWFAFDDGDALIAHLGMSGQFRVDDPDQPLHKHTRVVFDLDSGKQLRFIDQRMFGGLTLVPGGGELAAPHIALDPFAAEFDVDAVATAIHGKRTTIKRALLDQRVVSGIGNIYADEALWLAQVHPETPTNPLSAARIKDVLIAAKDVMTAALAVGGTSFDSLYVNINGESGYFSLNLNAYGRENEPCPRCGEPIRREAFTNRSSHFCPKCQRK